MPARIRSRAAFSLVEVLVSVGIIGLVAGSSVFALLDSNRFAMIDRLRTAAKAACQEKIDQALTVPYSLDAPPVLFLPSPSATAIPAPNGNPDRGTLTLTEDKNTTPPFAPLYADQDGVAVVQGTRTTRASLSDSTLGLVRVWVRVDYTFRGKAYSYEMYVVRAPD